MKEGPSQSKWPNYFSPFIADPMTLIRFHGYKIALNTNPSSSIPHTPVWPPPFSCTAAVLTSLSRPSPIPLGSPSGSSSSTSRSRRSSLASSRERCPPAPPEPPLIRGLWRQPRMEDGSGDGLLDLKTRGRPPRSSMDLRQLTFPTSAPSSDISGGSSPTSPAATTTRFSAPRSTPCTLVPLFLASSPLLAIFFSICFSSISCRP